MSQPPAGPHPAPFVAPEVRFSQHATAHVGIATRHKLASAEVLSQRRAQTTGELLLADDSLRTATSNLRTYALDMEDAEDVARCLSPDCSAVFANVSLMLESTLMAQRRRAAAAAAAAGHGRAPQHRAVASPAPVAGAGQQTEGGRVPPPVLASTSTAATEIAPAPAAAPEAADVAVKAGEEGATT